MPRFQQGFVQNRQSGDIRQRKYRRQRRNKSGRIHVALKLHRYALLALMAGALAGGKAQAQNWPEKPITFVVPFAAGGGTDAFAPPLAAQLDNQLGTRVLIENRAGAGGTVGAGSYTHLRAHETVLDLVCRLLLEKKKSVSYTHLRSPETGISRICCRLL